MFDEGNYTEAARLLGGTKLKDAASYFLLGRSLVLGNQISDGITALRKAIELAPHEARYLYELGTILRVSGATDEAKNLFAEGRKRFPKEARFRE